MPARLLFAAKELRATFAFMHKLACRTWRSENEKKRDIGMGFSGTRRVIFTVFFYVFVQKGLSSEFLVTNITREFLLVCLTPRNDPFDLRWIGCVIGICLNIGFICTKKRNSSSRKVSRRIPVDVYSRSLLALALLMSVAIHDFGESFRAGWTLEWNDASVRWYMLQVSGLQ